MKNTVVITGGAGGMGLATAKLVGRDLHVVISDVDPRRIESALAELTQLGIRCEGRVCDVTDPASVDALVEHAASLGKLESVIRTAGISPQMAEADAIVRVNALGTLHVVNACHRVAHEGFALVNVASMAAHLIPSVLLPVRAYPLASTNAEAFLRRARLRYRFAPSGVYRNGIAYSISKHYVVWLTKKSAHRFGEKGARIVSVSPGTFDTTMGRLEEKSGSVAMLEKAALKRLGRPEEVAELLAFCASDKASYITGTDILCDGGVIASRA